MTESRISEIQMHFPRLAELLGHKALETYIEELHRRGNTVLWQMEQDLVFLGRYVSRSEIAGAYRQMLRNGQFIETMHEIRVAATLSTVARSVELHVPIEQINGNCDVQCVIDGTPIFVEVTTRTDPFPRTYESDNIEDKTPEVRVTVEREWSPTTAGDDPGVRGIPASQELRERIHEKVGQFPSGEVNVLVLGSRGGLSLDMEAALLGDEVYRFYRGNSLRRGGRTEQVPNGLFCLPDDQGGVSRISALIWVKLAHHFHDMRVYSRLFLNPLAACPLSSEAKDVLVTLFDRREILERELDRVTHILVERYSPERIILFGSLAASADAGDTVHQWSDIDLAVVKETPLPFVDRSREIMDLAQPAVGLNVFVYTPEEFTRLEREGHFFIRDEILQKGRLLFDARARALA